MDITSILEKVKVGEPLSVSKVKKTRENHWIWIDVDMQCKY